METIICERRTYKNVLTTHCHGYSQLLLPLSGILDIETDNKKLKLDQDKIFFIPTNCRHIFKSENPNEFLVLDISNRILNSNSMDNFQDGVQCNLDERWKAIRFLILNELNTKNTESLIRLFHYFYPMILSENTSPSIKYIYDHFNENIALQTLANIEHYNLSYYSEWFKNTMKISPMKYIQKLRIERAKELLRYTDLKIINIAMEVGYSHHSSFTRIFRAYEQISPDDYRSKVRSSAK